MQFKKLAAIAGSALMAGLSLAAPVLATSVTKLSDINKLVSATTTPPTFPMFVIGATAATSDVAGAVDMATNLASNAVVTQQVATSGTGVSVTGGVSMATPANPLVMWNNFASSKQVLTATDLPDVLASDTYTDANSVSSPYSQYLTFNNSVNGRITYDTDSAVGQTSPSLGLKFTGNYQVYNYLLAFTKQLSEASSTAGSVTNMVNTQLDILGKTWTITNAQVNAAKDLDLTMLSGKNAQTVTTDTPATYTVGSSTYTVTLVAVGTIGSSDAATITVSGGTLAAPQTLQILSGGTKSLPGGTLVGVTSIFKTTKTGAIDSATVFIGADKLELEDTALDDTSYYAGVKLNGQSVNDVTVRMIGNSTGTSSAAGTTTLNSIEVAWTPTTDQFVSSGNTLGDHAFNAFNIFFGGISPAIADTTNRETITVTPSGTTASLSFKDASGNNVNQNFVKSSAAGAGNVAFTDAGGYALHALEGEAVAANEYTVLGQNSLAGSAQNPFGHIIRVLTINNVSTSTSQFQDVASGTTLTVTGGNTTMYLDGQAYKVCVNSTDNGVKFTWGTSAGYCSVGDAYDVFPTIQTSKGGWVAITNPATITTSAITNYTFNLPTGSLTINSTAGPTGLQTVGAAKYNVTAGGTSIVIRATDNSAAVFTTPGVMFVEGLDENTARNVVALRLDADTTYNRVDIAAAPAFTGTVTSTPGVSGTTQNQFMDQFGSYVTYDSTSPGTFSLSYPSTQVQAAVGVGANPSSSTGGVGGTVTTQTVLPITADIVKITSDQANLNEVTASDKTNNDLVLVGGPCINNLVADLATAGKFPYTCANWPGRDFGRIQLISDAFATGKTALVVAGTHAAQTRLASSIVQNGLIGASATVLASSETEVTGSVSAAVYS